MSSVRVDKVKVLKAVEKTYVFYDKERAKLQELYLKELMKPRETWFGWGKPVSRTREEALEYISSDIALRIHYSCPSISEILSRLKTLKTMCLLATDDAVHISLEDCKLLGNFIELDS